VARCPQCSEEIAGFEEMREMLPSLAELPEISWNRMAAEIKANVRLGLEAGECVRNTDLPMQHHLGLGGWRPVVAFASVVMLVCGCLVLERPAPVVHAAGPSVRSTSEGIQLQNGDGHMLGLMNSGAEEVTYTFSAQGSMGAQYIDPQTGAMTINTVYVQ